MLIKLDIEGAVGVEETLLWHIASSSVELLAGSLLEPQFLAAALIPVGSGLDVATSLVLVAHVLG